MAPATGCCRFGRFELAFDAHLLLEKCRPMRIGEQPLRALRSGAARAFDQDIH
ncbi:MAG: hypothetical protein ACRD1E_13515 [Terriglobales bacterium]